MVENINKAFDLLKTFPKEDRDRISLEIIERLEDKAEWDKITSTPKSQKWLEVQSKRALKECEKHINKLSLTFLSMPLDNLLREKAYWKQFDELPFQIRKLAEKNYQLWKENPQHPGLRFKKIHAKLPIYSFRVGMMHRTVGVETGDGRVVWFWVGSFELFNELLDQ
ncbi:MAG: hypothetical protein H8E36_08545 [Rhodospirillaceae bacterium]|nr:hypothetical protein [Rhodospirillaceae bacterium]MBL6930729.1 hypothetical protein [Rhodospirillales bacterium]